MAKASPIITAFNSGELSPLMAGRVDLKYYQNACKKLLNFVPTVQGPVRNRPGTKFVAEVKNSADRTWLRRFVFNQDQSYIIEFGNLYARFYSEHGVIESTPGVPFEITTPFTAASLTRDDGTCRLQFAQTGDVLYITSDGQFAVQKLIRLTATTFSIAALETTGGPFLDVDPVQTTTVYASAATGAGVTLTASASIFTAAHVGSLLFLEQKKVDGVTQWEPGKAISAGNMRRSDGKNYNAATSATTGAIRPVHAEGSRYDGDTGVLWDFLEPGYGWVKITGYTSGTVATATVISRLPAGAVGSGNPTTRWAFGAFSAVEGWPDNVAFHRERLCFSKGLKLYFSVAADFENFNRRDDGGLITADMAAIVDITSDESNAVVWMTPFSAAFLVGTSGEEYAIDELTESQPFGPGNINSKRQSKHGSNFAGTAVVGEGVVFVQAAGKKVRDMTQAESVENRWASSDVTVLAEHITRNGVVSMAYQQEPDSTLWAVCSCGSLVGFTLNREQDVRGWHPHQLGGYAAYDAATDPAGGGGRRYRYQNSGGGGGGGGGGTIDTSIVATHAVVECVDSIPIDGGDEVWMIVNRYINGSTVRYVEYMTQQRRDFSDPEDAFYVDSGLVLNNTINATLTPGVGADVVGSVGVEFTAGSSVFVVGDIGRRIHYRYSIIDDYGYITWAKAVAEITGRTSGTKVTATIHSAWPSLDLIPANEWRMTVTTISGLDHLEGQTVTVCGDGASLPEVVVTSGSITLAGGVSKASVGLPYRSVMTPMPLEAGAADGTAQGKTKRISRCSIRFNQTLGAEYGRADYGQLDPVLSRDAGGIMDTPPDLFTGDVTVAWPDGYSEDALITIVQNKPLPCTVVALMPQITTQDNR